MFPSAPLYYNKLCGSIFIIGKHHLSIPYFYKFFKPLIAQRMWNKSKMCYKYGFYDFDEVLFKMNNIKHNV